MRKLYTLAICLILFTVGNTQVRFTSVDLPSNEITLKNFGTTMEDVSDLRLCSLFDYDALNAANVTIVSGDLMLAPGESVTLAWNSSGMDISGADLGLYTASGSFASAANMLDFVQWGSGGNGREGVAASAGLWLAGEFISTAPPYFFSGDAPDFGLLFWSSNPPSTTGPCSDLFFSEYIEGSGNNKAIEIYNPTGAAIDLSDYQIQRFSNGGVVPGGTFSWDPGTMLNDDDVWLSVNGSADAALLAVADEDTSSITFFNGDDAMVLYKISTGDTLDIIGIVGNDPGANWPVGAGSTANNTLVRMPSVQEGTTDWSLSATQWNVLAQNDFSNAGTHTMIPCGVATPFLNFASGTLDVEENAGTLNIGVGLSNSNGTAVDVDVTYLGGTATNVDDFMHTLPTTLSFSGAMDESMTFSIDIVDDADVEGAETIILALANATGGAVTDVDTLTITIGASDAGIPTYPIGDINNVDLVGVADSIGVECKIVGTVYGVNLRPGGLQFTMHDGTGGIGVFNGTGDLGYTVQEGDEIRMIGSISQFSGLTQMNPDSIVFISAGNPLNDPIVITVQGESDESELVRLECVSLDDPSQWSPGGAGFNVDVSNANGSYVLRIDADVDLFNAPAPTGLFTVTGIGGQFDNSSPFDSGYQILPRYVADINENDAACVEPPSNDACAGAIDISDLFVIATPTESQIFTNVGATVQAIDPIVGWECFGEPDGGGATPSLENNVWFTFSILPCEIGVITELITTDCNGTVTDYIDDGDTQIALYSGDCGNLVPVACNEDSPNATNGNFFAGLNDVDLIPNTDYYLMIDGFSFNGANSDGEFCIQVLFDCGFGINELSGLEIKAFPNPGNGELIIETEANISNIQIFNALGQEVAFTSQKSFGKVNIDMNNNEAGIYQIVVQSEEASSTLQYVLTK